MISPCEITFIKMTKVLLMMYNQEIKTVGGLNYSPVEFLHTTNIFAIQVNKSLFLSSKNY